MEVPQPPKLLDRLRQTISFRHFSRKTEKSYLYYIRDVILFDQKRHPREMGLPEVRAYLSHLAVDKKGDDPEALVIRLLYGTGMRLSECLRLRGSQAFG